MKNIYSFGHESKVDNKIISIQLLFLIIKNITKAANDKKAFLDYIGAGI